ncbi:MAG TPA: SOS response-associated peptidase [Myxococcota bacterium]|nr:SOS response-associated peptidase [Myxococcota bacterium]
MCGRYTLHTEKEALAKRFEFDPAALAPQPARYNIAPTQNVLVLVNSGGGREPRLMRWGLVPPYAKEIGEQSLLVNARAETLAEKSAFRDALRAQRCLVLADGFYEWQAGGARNRRVPHWIARGDHEPFAMAGLYAEWRRRDELLGEILLSCAIVTTQANAAIAKLHDRMPVILQRSAEGAWIDPELNGETETLLALLEPVGPEALESRPVSRRVNSVKNDDPSLIALDDSEPSLGFF